jgi:hypothetical protein
MKVISVGPFLTGSLVWRPAPDRWVLTVVAKATFTLKPGKVGLAAEQQGLDERERHWSDDEARSLYSPCDLVPFKRRVDVVLVGQAFAPRGAPARSLVARLGVGEIDKSIEVHPDRALTREGELREGGRWTSMPLLYERAAGGPETWNPVGVSREAPPDSYGQRLLPNLQAPSAGLSDADLAAPVGFGPIPASWRCGRRPPASIRSSSSQPVLRCFPLREGPSRLRSRRSRRRLRASGSTIESPSAASTKRPSREPRSSALRRPPTLRPAARRRSVAASRRQRRARSLPPALCSSCSGSTRKRSRGSVW